MRTGALDDEVWWFVVWSRGFAEDAFYNLTVARKSVVRILICVQLIQVWLERLCAGHHATLPRCIREQTTIYRAVQWGACSDSGNHPEKDTQGVSISSSRHVWTSTLDYVRSYTRQGRSR